jgi:hypothetical protein
MDRNNNIDWSLNARIARLQQQAGETVSIIGRDDGNQPPPREPPMSDDRIGRLEGIVEGLRHGQTLTLTALGFVLALVIAFGVYGVKRMDDLNEKMGSIPGQISRDVRDLTNALSAAITASKQQPPQVILMPQSVIPPAPSPRPDNQ